MDFTSLHHIAIIVSEYEVSKKFYTEILNFKILSETYRSERNSYKLDLRHECGLQIELFSFPNTPKRPSYPEACGLRHLALSVADIDETVRELVARGVSCESIRIDPHTTARFTFFSDPDGLPIELYEQM
jgi:glyoxylase I family protein